VEINKAGENDGEDVQGFSAAFGNPARSVPVVPVAAVGAPGS